MTWTMLTASMVEVHLSLSVFSRCVCLCLSLCLCFLCLTHCVALQRKCRVNLDWQRKFVVIKTNLWYLWAETKWEVKISCFDVPSVIMCLFNLCYIGRLQRVSVLGRVYFFQEVESCAAVEYRCEDKGYDTMGWRNTQLSTTFRSADFLNSWSTTL